jgi:signal transduction histidine kinase
MVRLGQAGAMYLPVGLLGVGLGFGILTLVTIQRSPQFSLAASVAGGPVVLLAAAWICLLAAAAHLSWGRKRRGPAVLLALAGLSWFVPEWDNPDAYPTLYAAAIILGAVTPALLLHAALAWSEGRLRGPTSRIVVFTGYVICFGVLGVVRALILDPVALDCADCPANPWLVTGDEGTLAQLETLGGIVAVGWLALGMLALVASRYSVAGRGRHSVLRISALAFLLTLLVWQVGELRDLHDRDPLAGRLWLTASLALIAMAAGALWQLARTRRARRAVNRIVLDLSRGKEPGHLRDAIAERLGDATLQLLYPKADGALIDAHGRTVDVGTVRAVTPLTFEGALLALLSHAPDIALSSEELNELATGMHLGLENEALTARALAEERDLRESGLRLLAARDAERTRLERDLHDGAQQRLVGMALGLQLLTRQCPGPVPEQARHELTLALGEVRAIAQGLSPPVLVDAGLGAALRSLAETRPLSIGIETTERVDPALETTVYQLVEQATRDAPGHVDVFRTQSNLEVRINVVGDVPDPTDVTDRVVTLDGRIDVRRDNGTTIIEATLPIPAGGAESATLHQASTPR